jgi:hypothetical protein
MYDTMVERFNFRALFDTSSQLSLSIFCAATENKASRAEPSKLRWHAGFENQIE